MKRTAWLAVCLVLCMMLGVFSAQAEYEGKIGFHNNDLIFRIINKENTWTCEKYKAVLFSEVDGFWIVCDQKDLDIEGISAYADSNSVLDMRYGKGNIAVDIYGYANGEWTREVYTSRTDKNEVSGLAISVTPAAAAETSKFYSEDFNAGLELTFEYDGTDDHYYVAVPMDVGNEKQVTTIWPVDQAEIIFDWDIEVEKAEGQLVMSIMPPVENTVITNMTAFPGLYMLGKTKSGEYTFEGGTLVEAEVVGAEPTPAPVIVVEETATPEPVTPKPTVEPTPEPTAEPTIEPTVEPTPEPTAEPTPAPTAEPTVEPTPEPIAEPTPVPTEEAADINFELVAPFKNVKVLLEKPEDEAKLEADAINCPFSGVIMLDGNKTDDAVVAITASLTGSNGETVSMEIKADTPVLDKDLDKYAQANSDDSFTVVEVYAFNGQFAIADMPEDNYVISISVSVDGVKVASDEIAVSKGDPIILEIAETTEAPTEAPTSEPTAEPIAEPAAEPVAEFEVPNDVQLAKRHLIGMFEGMGHVEMIVLIVLLAAAFGLLCFSRTLINPRSKSTRPDNEEPTVEPGRFGKN